MNVSLISIFLFVLLIMSNCANVNKTNMILTAHSHNDYEHERPLFDALDCNFKSFEADVYSIGDSLFVAHDFDKIGPGRTLRKLYLEPLKKRITENGGSVYGNAEEIILFIDIKDDGLKTYKLLHKILQDYKPYFTFFENGIKTKSSILAVVSGNRPFEFMKSQALRFAGFDGRLKNLDSGIPASVMPIVSDNWSKHFTWDAIGELPANEKNKLHSLVSKAKSNGYMLRFWGTPNKTEKQRNAIWKELSSAGVDLIGTDYPKELQKYLQTTN